MPDFLNDPLLDQVVNPSTEVNDSLLDQAVDVPTIAKPNEIDVAATLAMIVGEAQALEPDVDRTKLGQLGVSLGRGAISVAEIVPQLRLLATSRIEKITGENFFTRHNNLVALAQIKQAEELKATKFPISRDETLTLRKSMGIVGEAIPQLIPATAMGIMTRGRSIPMSINLFAGTAAFQATGAQFMESAIETGDLDKAAIEAGATGLVVFGLSRAFPGNALFAKLPKQVAANAALRVSARMAGGAVGESIEEGTEAVFVEAIKGMVRSDPEKFKNIYRGDPEFWGGVLEQMIGGAGAGGVAGITVGSIEVAQDFKDLAKAKVTEKTIDEVHELLIGTEDVTTDLSELSVEDRKGILTALDEEQKLVREKGIESEEEADRFRKLRERAVVRPGPQEAKSFPVPADPPIEPARARRIVEELGERAKVAEEAETAAAEPAPPTEGPIRDQQERIRQLLVELGPPETVSEVQTLKEEVSEVKRAGKEAVSAVKVQALDDLKQLRLDAINKQRPIDALKGELSRLAKENIKGREVPKKLLTDIGKIKTIGDLARGIRTVRNAVAVRNKSDAVARLKTAINKVGDPKKLREQYRESVGRLLDSVRLADLSEPMRARLNGLKEVIAKEPDISLSPRIQKLVGELDKVPVSQISTDEVTAMAEALESIAENQAQFEKFSRKAQAQRIDTLSTKIAGEIDQNTKSLPRGPGGRLLRSPKFRSGLLGYVRLMYGLPENSDLDTLSELMGGQDSTTWSKGFKEVSDTQREGRGRFFGHKDALGEFLKAEGRGFNSAELHQASKELAGEKTMVGKILDVLGVNNAFRTDPILQKIKIGNETLEISSAERMGIMATLSDPETFDQTIFRKRPIQFDDEATGKFRSISLKDYQAIVDGASQFERRMVQFALDRINNEMKADMAAHSMAKNLYDITKKETWYPRHARTQGTRADITADGLDGAFHKGSGLNPSITKARTENIDTPIVIKDIFVEYNNLAFTNSMYTSMEPSIRTFKKVLNSSKVRKVLDGSKAAPLRKAYDQIFDQVAREITGAPPLRGMVEQSLLPTIQKLPKGLLALNPRIGVYQTVSGALYANEIRGVHVWRAFLTGAMFRPGLSKEMMLHPDNRFRRETTAVGILNDATQTGIPMIEKQKGEWQMALIRIMDWAALKIGWQAAKFQAQSEAAKSGEKVSEDEIRRRHWEIFSLATSRTQPMFDSVHIPVRAIEAKRSTFLKLQNFFRAQRNKLDTMTIRSGIRMLRNPTRAVIMNEAENIVRTTILNSFAIAAIGSFATFKVLSGDDDGFWKKFGAKFIRTMASIPFLGNWVGEGIIAVFFRGERAFDPDTSPIESVGMGIIRGSGKASRGATEGDMKKMLSGAAEMAASVAAFEGIPAPFLLRETENLIDAIMEDDKKHGVTPP